MINRHRAFRLSMDILRERRAWIFNRKGRFQIRIPASGAFRAGTIRPGWLMSYYSGQGIVKLNITRNRPAIQFHKEKKGPAQLRRPRLFEQINRLGLNGPES